MKISNCNKSKIVLLCASALLLTACGGGSNNRSTTSATPATPATPPTPPAIATNLGGNVASPASRTASATSAGTAADATPVSGSVTQSSNVGGSSGDVTLDQVSATATYSGSGSDSNLIVSVTNGLTGSWGTVGTSDETLRSLDGLEGIETGNTYRERLVGKTIGTNGLLAVDVFTDRLDNAQTDYLVGGVWLYVPDVDTTTGIEIGAFADGPDENLTPTDYLATDSTATYNGDVTGIYVDTAEVGEFIGNVVLDAVFGGTPTISGSINSLFVTNDERVAVTNVLGALPGGAPDAPEITITLGTAVIDTASAGGFFTGDTSVAASPGNYPAYAGKWGGQFYGTAADDVAGTFGASTVDGTDAADQESFVGAYIGKKQ